MRPVLLPPLGRHRWSEHLAKLGITVRYECPASSLYLHNSVKRSHEGEELPMSEDRRATAMAVSSCSDFGVAWTALVFSGRCSRKDTTVVASSSSRGSVGSQQFRG